MSKGQMFRRSEALNVSFRRVKYVHAHHVSKSAVNCFLHIPIRPISELFVRVKLTRHKYCSNFTSVRVGM